MIEPQFRDMWYLDSGGVSRFTFEGRRIIQVIKEDPLDSMYNTYLLLLDNGFLLQIHIDDHDPTRPLSLGKAFKFITQKMIFMMEKFSIKIDSTMPHTFSGNRICLDCEIEPD